MNYKNASALRHVMQGMSKATRCKLAAAGFWESGRPARTFFLKYTDDLSKRSVLFP